VEVRGYNGPLLMDCTHWKPNGERCPVTMMDGKGNGVVVHYNQDGTVYSRITYKDGKTTSHVSSTGYVTQYRNNRPVVGDGILDSLKKWIFK
jgi:antitoxin component YwqK of YwqJK toxin-antitoxin module